MGRGKGGGRARPRGFAVSGMELTNDHKTEKMREARHELQTLSASDPAVQANMFRHVRACTQLLTGRLAAQAQPAEPMFGAGFRFEDGEEKLFSAFTRNDGLERIYIAFDIDDAQGPPIGIGLFRKEGENVVCYGMCKLWSPTNDGRALLVPNGEGGTAGYFAFRRGHPFRWIDGPLPGNFDAGVRRAQSRLKRLLQAAEAEPAAQRGLATIVSNVGQTIFTQPFPLAA